MNPCYATRARQFAAGLKLIASATRTQTSVNRTTAKNRRPGRGRGAALLLVAAILAGTTSVIAADREPVITAMLVWTNGDSLPGELLSSTESHLSWQSPLFVSPLTLDRKYLASVEFARLVRGSPKDVFRESAKGVYRADLRAAQHVESQRSVRQSPNTEPFRFHLSNGDLLYGRLLDLADEHVVVQSRRHGRCNILRTALQSFEQVRRVNPKRSELNEISGWTTLRQGRQLSDWKRSESGQFSTSVSGAELLSEVQLHPMSVIQVVLRWKEEPGFLIAFASPNLLDGSFAPVKLETWGDQLVLQTLQTNGNFKQIRKIPAKNQSLQLQLYWNQAAGEVSVFSDFGRLLGKMTGVPEDGTVPRNLYIRNNGSDLTVADVRVSQWSGNVPKSVIAGLSRILLMDGKAVYGRIRAFDAEKAALVVVEPSGAERQLLMKQVAAVHLADLETRRSGNSQDQITYFDGTLLRGTVQSIDDGVIQLKTSYSDQPIAAGLEGAREWKFGRLQNTAETPQSTIEFHGGRLKGQLATVESALGWQPIGSSQASALSPNARARIVLETGDDPETEEDVQDHSSTDVVYLNSGDAIPCSVETLDESNLHLTTHVSDATRIPRRSVKAVEFNSDGHRPLSGFGGRWTVTEHQKDAVELTDDMAVIRGSATLDHESILRGDDVRFELHWDTSNAASMTVSLYADSTRRQPHQPDFTRSGYQFQIYLVQKHIQVRGLRQQNRALVQRLEPQDGRVTLQFSLEGGTVHLLVDGKKMASQKLHDSVRPGRGIVLNVQQLQVRARARPNQKPVNSDLITISNFKVSRSNGVLQGLRIDDEQKEHVLTVPRMRSKNPPTHVLLAQNGDLLRGRLIEMTATHARFISRLTEFEFPRDRLAGIVWLDAEQDEQVPRSGGAKLTVRAVLNNGSAVTLDSNQVVSNKLVGRSESLGQFSIPMDEIHELIVGDYTTPEHARPYADWRLRPAKEPQFAGNSAANSADPHSPAAGFGVDSPLVGTVANDFEVPLLSGESFRLSQHSGKVVILDFWATWCGPCVRAMPQLIETVRPLPQEKVVLLAVNQQESKSAVEEFLETRGWDVKVALDRDGRIGQEFQVDALPQTVIIGPDGRIKWLHIGAHPELEQEFSNALQQIVGSSAESPPDPRDNPSGDATSSPEGGDEN